MGFLFSFLSRNLKGYRVLVVLAILVSFADVAVEILEALPLKYIPAKLQNPQSAKSDPDAIWSSFVSFFDRFSPEKAHGDVHTVLGVILFSAVLLIVATLLDSALGYAQLYLAAFIGQNLTARLRKKLFEQIQRLSLDWHGKQKKGDIVQRVTGNIADIEKFVTDGLVDLLTGILTIVGVASIMFHYSVPYTLISIVIVPALVLVVFSYVASIKAASKKAAKAAGVVSDVAVEDVGAITVIKAFDLMEREADRFNKYVDKTKKAGLRAGSLQAQFTPLVTLLVGAGTAVIVGIGAYVAAGNTFHFVVTIPSKSIDIGTVILFITLLGKLFQPMKDLSKLTNVATAASAAAERVQDVFDQAPEVVETNVPYNGPTTLQGDIAFENVTFGYTPEKLILKGINLHISAGKKVALVGLSGGGKTTLVKLIPRFYEVTSGVVKLDGRDNREYPLSLLRQNVGMVLQESVLFEGTVLENLKIARPNATMEEVINAAKQAHIHDVIMSWPEGYNTQVRNQGKNFSGGQRQRLAIARALLSNARILILDEPTAALDVEAELEVMTALEKLVEGRTVLMISHRLSTLGNVDEIIVLKDGMIVEQGTYKELKRRPNGVFAELLSKQKQYDVDYAGKSIIVPRAEIARLTGRSPSVDMGQALSSAQSKAYVNGQNGSNGARTRARILVEVEGTVINQYELTKTVMSVGRQKANDIYVASERVSRHHAKIRWENGAWVIEDTQSLNGLNYHGELVDQHRFMNEDRIYLAPKVVLTYQEENPVAASSWGPVSQPIAPVVPASYSGTPVGSPVQPVAPVMSPPQPVVPIMSPQKEWVVVEVDGKAMVARPLDKDVLTIGRQSGMDIHIPLQQISGQHAVLMKQDGRWQIVDTKSRNGLVYEGRRVERHVFSKGDGGVYLAPNVRVRFDQV
jgi:ABC-type multidrug transport system fused ATPase/permease subunit/pSer/pThr/pTyr-binding forkhead associated (FHA) protein